MIAQEIVFILSSLNDVHFRKRVEEFVEHGYTVKVYGFKRRGQMLSDFKYEVVVLGEIENRNFKSRISLFKRSIKKIAEECRGKLCFYSSLDVAIFGRIYIKAPYLYEVCDLTETTIGNALLRKLLKAINRNTIKNSLDTIFTSEGFYDFFSKISKDKISLIPNKVSTSCPEYKVANRTIDGKFKIGFVGVIRFASTYNFIKVCAENFPNVEIHLFGIYSDGDGIVDKIKVIEKKSANVFFHGRFKNPDDLPAIYSKIDMVLAAYPPVQGVVFAEPNKLYEAIYFRCPIIVSKHTFLGAKVNRLGIGYVIDSMDEDSIKNFLESLNVEEYKEKCKSCYSIAQQDCLNVNTWYFEKLKKII